MAKAATRLRGKSRTHAFWLMVAMFGLACGPVGDAIAREDAAKSGSVHPSPDREQMDARRPARPLLLLARHRSRRHEGQSRSQGRQSLMPLPSRTNITRPPTGRRCSGGIANWGINTIGAFSDTSEFARRGMPYTVLISHHRIQPAIYGPPNGSRRRGARSIGLPPFTATTRRWSAISSTTSCHGAPIFQRRCGREIRTRC